MLSLGCKRYYEPLRLPFRAAALSLPIPRGRWPPHPQKRVSSTGQSVFHNMPFLLPRESTRTTSVVSARVQRPSPSDHRVGFSTSLTRLRIGSRALRPALSLCGHSRPRVTTTPLPHATTVYGQLLGRDFNPLDILLLLRTIRSFFISKVGWATLRFCSPVRAMTPSTGAGRSVRSSPEAATLIPLQEAICRSQN
jgi:hypothetical protein